MDRIIKKSIERHRKKLGDAATHQTDCPNLSREQILRLVRKTRRLHPIIVAAIAMPVGSVLGFILLLILETIGMLPEGIKRVEIDRAAISKVDGKQKTAAMESFLEER